MGFKGTKAEKKQHTFQVLNIPTKINKGTVKIVAHVELIHKGEKVGSSKAALLAKLRIRPFSYGLVAVSIYDNGSVFSLEVLDLIEEDLVAKFSAGVLNVAALLLGLGYPMLVAASHTFVKAFKNVVSVSLAIEYFFPQTDTIKEILKDLRKFIVTALMATTKLASPTAAEKVKEKKEDKEESEDKMGFGLFN